MAVLDAADVARQGEQLNMFAAKQVPLGVSAALRGAPGEPATGPAIDPEMRPISPEMAPYPSAPPPPAPAGEQVAGGPFGAIFRAAVGGKVIARAADDIAAAQAEYSIVRILDADPRFEAGATEWDVIASKDGTVVSSHASHLQADTARQKLLSGGPALARYSARRARPEDNGFTRVSKLPKGHSAYTLENPWAVVSGNGTVLSTHPSKQGASSALRPYIVVTADGTFVSRHATRPEANAAVGELLAPPPVAGEVFPRRAGDAAAAVHAAAEIAERVAVAEKLGVKIDLPPPQEWALLSPETRAHSISQQQVVIRPTEVEADAALRSILEPRDTEALLSGNLADFRTRGSAGNAIIPDNNSTWEIIETLSTTYRREIDDLKRDTISKMVTQDLANYMGMDPAALSAALENMGRTGGVPIVKNFGLSETLLAVRNLLFTEVSKLDQLAALATNRSRVDGEVVLGVWVDSSGRMVGPSHEGARQIVGGSAADLVNFRQQFMVVANLQAQVKGAQTEVARSLNTFKYAAGLSPGDLSTNIDNILTQFGGEADVAKLAEAYFLLPRGSSRAQFTKVGKWRKWSDAAFEVWINLLLSGPPTHAKNFIANGLMVFANLPVNAWAAGRASARRAIGRDPGGGATWGEVRAQAFGQMMAVREAWQAVARNARYGETPIAGSKIELEQAGQRRAQYAFSAAAMELQPGWFARSVDMLGTALTFGRLPTKMLGAEDTFWKIVSQRGVLWQQAYRSALDLGLEGGDAAEHITQFMLRPPKDAVAHANREAVRDALQTPLETDTGRLAATIARHQLQYGGVELQYMRWFMPFVKTPYNAVTYAFEHTPLAAMTRRYQAAMESGDQAMIDRAKARRALGTSASLVIAWQTMSGDWTGRGPADPALRALWLDQGWRPYSRRFVFADGRVEYRSYAGLEPFSTVVGLVVDAVEMLHRLDVTVAIGGGHPFQDQMVPKEAQDALAKLSEIIMVMPFMLAEHLTHKSFMKGFADLTNMLADGERYAGSVATGFVSSLVPSLLRSVNKVGWLETAITGEEAYLRRGYEHEAMPPEIKSLLEDTAFGQEHRDNYAAVLDRYEDWAWIADQLDRIRAQIPGLSYSLPVRRNFWGEPILKPEQFGPDLISPYERSAFEENPLNMEMIRLNVRESDHTDFQTPFPLTYEERARFEELAGQEMLDRLGGRRGLYARQQVRRQMSINGQFPRNHPAMEAMKAEWLKAIREGREAALRALMRDPEFPDLRAARTAANKLEQLQGAVARYPGRFPPP